MYSCLIHVRKLIPFACNPAVRGLAGLFVDSLLALLVILTQSQLRADQRRDRRNERYLPGSARLRCSNSRSA